MKCNRGFVAALFLCLLALASFGCTQQQRAKSFGGTAKTELEACQKLVMATWKDDDLWLLTKPMSAEDVAETYTFTEDSSFGVMEGTVVLKEVKNASCS